MSTKSSISSVFSCLAMVFCNKTSETRECARHVGNVRRVKWGRGDFLYICAFHSLRYLHSFSKFVFWPGKKKVSYTTKPFVLITKPSLGAIDSTKTPTGPTGKSGPPQKVDPFFRNFSGWTEPIFGLMDCAQTPIQYSHGRVGRC